MSGVELLPRRVVTEPAATCAAIGLIGPGNVGSRVLSRMAAQHWPGLFLSAIANSRRMVLSSECLAGRDWQGQLAGAELASDVDRLADFVGELPVDRRILVDVTASAEVAERHARWLADGFEVVTANKWAASGPQEGWARLERPNYFHATTVGAGLPILATLAGLRRAGERIAAIEGVLSGTLSYLTACVNAGYSFADSVVEAHELGLTEPDPRLDLNGIDVARKLVIAARAGGLALDLDDVEIDSLVPPDQAHVPTASFLAATGVLDGGWQRARERCPGNGSTLCHVGRLICDAEGRVHARVGLARYERDHPFVAISPGDNIVTIRTETYGDDPIWIRGPGAGAEVTALQVFSQILAGARA